MLAKKQAIFNNVEEHEVHGAQVLQLAFSVDNCMIKLIEASTKSQAPAVLSEEARHIFFPECRLCDSRTEAGR